MKNSKKPLQLSQIISVMQKTNQTSKVSCNFQQRKDQPMTPTKIQQRVNNSPLRLPLQKAIHKAIKDKSSHHRSPNKSRISGKSIRREDNCLIKTRKLYNQQQSQEKQLKAHTETYNFIKKYFDFSIPTIPIDLFVNRLVDQFEGLWGNQNAQHILQDFSYKIRDMFGDHEIQIRELVRVTKDDGMIGLILQIFKGIKNQEASRISYQSFNKQSEIMNIHKSFQSRLQDDESITNIKNVVQQFMQTMYICMQKQIYAKFNVQMRRMVLKYRDAQKIIKKVNQKLTTHADTFHLERKLKEQQRYYQNKIEQLKRIKQKSEALLERDKEQIINFRQEKDKMQQQIHRLKDNLEKYQNAILNKALQNLPINNTDQTASRRILNSALNDKTYDILNSQNSYIEPVKVHIDTHIMHRQYGHPQMKTTTTFLNGNSVSPSKIDDNHFYSHKYSNNAYNRGNSSPFNLNLPYQTKPYR